MDYEFGKQIEAEKTAIQGSVQRIKESGIFDNGYIDQVKLAFNTSDKDKMLVHHSSQISIDDSGKYSDIRGFELGIRRDFIPLEDKQSYEATFMQMHESQRIQELFYTIGIPYDEFVAHELAHNVYDRAYVKTYGEFEVFGDQDPGTKDTKGVITDVSEEYRTKIIGKLKEILTEADINLAIDNFFGDERNNRQKIAEIYALMVQREFAYKINSSYIPEHQAVDSKIKSFLKNPEQAIADYNQRTGRQISLENFYRENHILSFVVVPLLEKRFRDFKERSKFLEVNTDGLMAN